MQRHSRDEFNDELESYISRRRTEREEKRGFLKRIFSSKERRRSRPEPSFEEHKEEELEEIEHEIEEIDEEEEELEEVRESLMTRFLKLFRSRPKEEVEEVETYDVEEGYEEPRTGFDEDLVKELVQIQHQWLERLDAQTMSRFKRDPDFERYKELLDELGLIER